MTKFVIGLIALIIFITILIALRKRLPAYIVLCSVMITVGGFSNMLVIGINGGLMPVYFDGVDPTAYASTHHFNADIQGASLGILGDRIPLRIDIIMSIGDVFIFIGGICFYVLLFTHILHFMYVKYLKPTLKNRVVEHKRV